MIGLDAVFWSSFKYNLATGAVISGLKVNSLSDLSLKLYNWSTISSPDFVVNNFVFVYIFEVAF